MISNSLYLVKAAVVCILVLTTACAAGITREQEKAYKIYQEKEILVEEKNPSTAFKLAFLPGGASFYDGDYDIAFLSLITWPVSILWEAGNAKSRTMLINYEATEEVVKKNFRKSLKSLDEKLRFGEIGQKEYRQEFSKIYQKYYNPHSFLLENYYDSASSYEIGSDDDKSSLSAIDGQIKNICDKEFEILSREVKSLGRVSFMHKCKIAKRKSFVDLGL